MIDDGLPTPKRYLAILAISFDTALVVIDGAIATVALPTIARDLKVDGSAAVLVVTIYQLVLVMTLLPFSALGDRVGLRRMYHYGQIVFVIATVLCFFARSLPLFADRACHSGARRCSDAQRVISAFAVRLSGQAPWSRSGDQQRRGFDISCAGTDAWWPCAVGRALTLGLCQRRTLCHHLAAARALTAPICAPFGAL